MTGYLPLCPCDSCRASPYRKEAQKKQLAELFSHDWDVLTQACRKCGMTASEFFDLNWRPCNTTLESQEAKPKMRTRNEIEGQLKTMENEIGAVDPAYADKIVIELLLDIRDLQLKA